MKKQNEQPKYHDGTNGKSIKPRPGGSAGGKDNHDLHKASQTLGQVYNVSSYDSQYKRKKGIGFYIGRIIIIIIGVFLVGYVVYSLLAGQSLGIR